MEKINDYSAVEAILDNGVNYTNYQCKKYELELEKDKDNLLKDAGKLILKATVAGLGGLCIYNGVKNGVFLDEMAGYAYASEIVGAVCGLSTGASLGIIAGVKDSLTEIIQSYKDYKFDKNSYENYLNEEESIGRGR